MTHKIIDSAAPSLMPYNTRVSNGAFINTQKSVDNGGTKFSCKS